jgi:hypothetical protein
MTPTDRPPRKGILLLADDKGPPALSSPEEPDQDDQMGGDASATCATCYAFRPSDGRCQLYPPHGMEWAQVDESDWCCQYKKGPQHDGAQQSAGTGIAKPPQQPSQNPYMKQQQSQSY